MAANTSLKVQTCLLLLMQQHAFRRTVFSSCLVKAANAGGVATSALEMSPELMNFPGQEKEVDEAPQHHDRYFHKADDAAKRYGMERQLCCRCKLAGFRKKLLML